MSRPVKRLATLAPFALFAIDNKLPNVIFLIVRRVLASASEGFDRYVLSLSIYPVSRSLIKDTSQLGSGSVAPPPPSPSPPPLLSQTNLPCRQFYTTLAFLSVSLTRPSNTD